MIAAREQGEKFEEPMIQAIQRAYYLQARNPSDSDTLTGVALEIGLDGERFASQLESPATQQQLTLEMSEGRSMGVQGFPSLVLKDERGFKKIQHDYLDARRILDQL